MKTSEMLVKARETEFKQLLDRERVAGDAKKLKRWIDVVEDLTDYGCRLIPRCFVSSERKLKDTVVIPILLHQVVSMLDAIEVLLSGGAVHAAHLQMRALFEAAIYIEWILKSDSEEKAKYYYVHNMRRKLMWARRAESQSAEAKEFEAIMGSLGIQIQEKTRKAAAEQIPQVEQLLAQPAYVEINKAFDETLARRRRRQVAWYEPLGFSSVRAIAKEVGKESYYLLLYSLGSEVMHSSSYDHHIRVGDGTIKFQPIRYFEGFANVFSFSVGLALGVYMRVLDKYRPGGRELFARKYSEQWRAEYLNFPQINYQDETTQI